MASSKAEETGVKLTKIEVRMYNVGFGDCFLLTFHHELEDKPLIPKNIWIDFGSRGSDKAITTNMQLIARDICALLPKKKGEPYVDVLVITHEHEDHISGFAPSTSGQAIDPLIDQLTIGQLWFAWTENNDFDLAREWRDYQNGSRLTLRKAFTAMNQGAYAKSEQLNRLQNLFGFEIGTSEVTRLADDDKSTSELGKKVYPYLREKLKKSRGTLAYKRPGDLIKDTVEGVRIYVLGPPEDMSYVRRDQSAKPGEMYLQASYVVEDFSLGRSLDVDLAMNNQSGTDDAKEKDFWHYVQKSPFDEEFVLPIPQANGKLIDFPEESYRTPISEQYREQLKILMQTDVYKEYVAKSNDWRNINEDYLMSANNLAMRLNSATNNTSLVLAFEIEETGEVLLFPGDAQFGVWLAWQDDLEKTQKDSTDKKRNAGKAPYDEHYVRRYQWSVPDKANPAQQQTVSVEDLLKRTVIYKVGHHGSHNATPKRTGLEKMVNPHLLALIPVDEKKARTYHWDEIPYLNLLEALAQQKADSVRSDQLQSVRPTEWTGQNGWKISYRYEKGKAGSECLLCSLEPSSTPD